VSAKVIERVEIATSIERVPFGWRAVSGSGEPIEVDWAAFCAETS
jgi:hypothetical protein